MSISEELLHSQKRRKIILSQWYTDGWMLFVSHDQCGTILLTQLGISAFGSGCAWKIYINFFSAMDSYCLIVTNILNDTTSHLLLLLLPFLFSPACLQESAILQLGGGEPSSSDRIPSRRQILQKKKKKTKKLK